MQLWSGIFITIGQLEEWRIKLNCNQVQVIEFLSWERSSFSNNQTKCFFSSIFVTNEETIKTNANENKPTIPGLNGLTTFHYD